MNNDGARCPAIYQQSVQFKCEWIKGSVGKHTVLQRSMMTQLAETGAVPATRW